MRRLMWMLGPSTSAAEEVDADEPRKEPRIVNWVGAPT